ncbi:hypothetical protein Tco_0911115 [Tanacetum coccineum]|uniref:Uncharacterized protein n=1 Tax=Tanacetum coccineum TaxID=301880 RepID=A0ABQ5CUV8_9ASTR
MWKQKWSPVPSVPIVCKHHLPVIDLSPSKSALATTQAPIFTVTTSTTTITRPLTPPLQQQQSTTDLELSARVMVLKQKFAAFEQKSKNLDNTTQNLKSRVFTLELRDLPHKIDEAQRMFETGSYKSLLEHIALYEALEAYMERAQRIILLLNRISLARDDVMMQTSSPPPQILIQERKKRHNLWHFRLINPPAP